MLPDHKGVKQVDHAICQHANADKGDQHLRRLERVQQNDNAQSDHQHRQQQQNAPLFVAVLFDIDGSLQLHNAVKNEVKSQNKGQNGGEQLRLYKKADAQRQCHNAHHQRKGGIAFIPVGNKAVNLPQTIGRSHTAQYIAKDVDGGGGPNNERNAQRHITDGRKDKIQYNFFRHGSNLP